MAGSHPLLAISLATALSASATPLVLGVLEHSTGTETQHPSARLLFEHRGGIWRPLGSEGISADLLASTWTLAFDGRSLGTLKLLWENTSSAGAPPGPPWCFTPAAAGTLPVIRNRAKAFEGWMGTPDLRPLVILSRPNVPDPDHWKPFTPDASCAQRLHAPLRLVLGRFSAVRCTRSDRFPEPWNFGPRDLVFHGSYRSASGQELVSIGIDPKKIGCEGPPQPEWSGHWFLLEGNAIEFMGRELELVDAGDYDRDGRSELLFWHSGYNRDGYVLLHDHLRRRVEYLWSYH